MNVPQADAIAAADANVLNASALPPQLRLATDTRTIAAGDTFVALRGDRFDGHAYLGEALARGAAALVVDDAAAVPDGAAALVVADTRAAYLAIAGAARRRSRARVVALTGSAGKTTTTAFVAQLLERLAGAGGVVATPRNENNEIGVAHLLLGLSEDTEFAVVEFGARHYGEIEPLTRAALPEVAVVTNIGDAHLEIFGTPERLAETKWGIFATGATPVLNATDSVSLARAHTLASAITWFGTARETVRTSALESDRTVLLLRAIEGDALAVIGPESGLYRAEINVGGEHNRENVAAAAAAAIALGFAASEVARALSGLRLPPGRYERHHLPPVDVIFDAYNASASGTLATLGSFAHENAQRRIAVLGSMAELGPDAAALHARVGAASAEANLEWLLVGGDFADDLARGARAAGFQASRIVYYASNAEAVAWLGDNGRPGDVILLKASRKYKLEEIVEGLRGARAGR
jgi:UDP-N-acetylmuramoyl-tripeptide--D-alanyl-D-alanine ligase